MAKPITVKLPEALHARVAAAARQRRITQSGLLREALERYLGGPDAEGTFGELTRDLCGVGAGAVDLSTHPKHMKGYGK